jgi:hypothetical protein
MRVSSIIQLNNLCKQRKELREVPNGELRSVISGQDPSTVNILVANPFSITLPKKKSRSQNE